MKSPILAFALSLLSCAAFAQTYTPANVGPTASGTQFMLQNGSVPSGHVPLATATAGQYTDGGMLPAAGSTPNPIQLTTSTTITAAQAIQGAIFWYSGSSAITATLPAAAAGLRAFFEVDGSGTLTITSPSAFVNLPGSATTLVLSQPYLSTLFVWCDGTSWHIGEVY